MLEIVDGADQLLGTHELASAVFGVEPEDLTAAHLTSTRRALGQLRLEGRVGGIRGLRGRWQRWGTPERVADYERRILAWKRGVARVAATLGHAG